MNICAETEFIHSNEIQIDEENKNKYLNRELSETTTTGNERYENEREYRCFAYLRFDSYHTHSHTYSHVEF